MWDMTRLSGPPAVRSAPGFEADGVKALFFEGPAYRGRPTRVFAWVGVPAVDGRKKVPGMVLVHGGGGTAFAEWVQLWNRRGYAAIAMDTCGCTPGGTHGRRPRHKFGGPPGWGGFGQIDWPRTDQWTWHAVSDVILAHSLLRSLPGVDSDRIGLTGISWGGYLACIVAGVDPRFRFAVPVYGCGFTTEHAFAGQVNSLGPERAARWMRWWDPSVYLPEARMPMLWVDGTNDFAYTLNALQKSYRLPKGPRTLCVRIRMPHSQGAGQSPKEIALFADALLRGGIPLARWTGQGREGRRVWASYKSSVPIEKAELIFTRDDGKWQDRNWEALPAELDRGTHRVSALLPKKTTCWFLNLTDRRGAVVSTEHEEIGL
ncbi:MAG: prolyl oligopeptidase family serine peptidase [Kiritimatiellaeota bacterium]|nr:prolyl oligopeptidase family serine peptidase [Kiritimatiellota bacterium]